VTDSDFGLSASRSGTAPLILAGSGRPRSAEDETPVVRVRRNPAYVLVTVAGEVDFATVAALRERLFALAGTGRPLVVDLDGVGFIDAAGLGVLAGAARRAAAHGASLHVVCSRRQIRRLFRITELDRVAPLADSLAEVLRVLAPGTNAEAV
jgi:anti-sigma B factor antagonist